MSDTSSATDTSRADVCIVACAEAFRGDGEIVASPMGTIPRLGALLAKRTFEPGLLLTDGEAFLLEGAPALGAEGDAAIEGYLPFRLIFDVLAAGKRHVMMGASQLDRYGNQNISAVGDWAQPKVQLLGARGAPGNTANHPTSYFVGDHSSRVFVESVDFVSGLGTDRAREVGGVVARDHDLRAIVTNLAVLDVAGPDGTMRIRSVHPGVSVDEVREATGFELAVAPDVTASRAPTDDELAIIEELDPRRHRAEEVRL